MHTEETENNFVFTELSKLQSWDYAYVWYDGTIYYFLYKSGEDIYIKQVEELSDTELSDIMWDNFDDYEAWKEAVADGDTEQWYDDRRSDIDIWDQLDSEDYYGVDRDVREQLYDLWLWSDRDSDSYDDYYLHYCWERTLNKESVERLYGRVDSENYTFNKELWNDLESMYKVNEIEFLNCEDIR